jgi:hypothetical protein
MSYSLYDATVVMAQGALKSLDRILCQAEQHPNAASFFTARLVDDMKPLTFQVHYATFEAEAMAAELCGQEYKAPEDDLDSYEKMHGRIEHALKELKKLDKESVNRVGETTTHTTSHRGGMEVPVKALASSKCMPNIYFHVSMAYAILRMEGVPLAKRDWSRAFVAEYV